MKAKYSCLIIFLISAFVSCLTINQVMAETKIQLKPFVATYMITAMGLEGINVTNSLSLSQPSSDIQKYHFKSYSMPIGLLAFKKDETRDEQSEGQITDGLIQPEHYSFVQLRNGKIRRDVELKFDWNRKEVSNHHKHKNNKWLLAIPEQSFDKLSYQLALMLKLADKPDKRFSFHIADGGKLKEYHFEILSEERVYTSLGSYKTIKIQHQRYQKGKIITLWCAPELNYLPVRMVQEETGKPKFISTLTSYQEGITSQ